jgi:hypothetical protein
MVFSHPLSQARKDDSGGFDVGGAVFVPTDAILYGLPSNTISFCNRIIGHPLLSERHILFAFGHRLTLPSKEILLHAMEG